MTEYKLHNGSGTLCCRSCGRQDRQLNTYDWLADIPGNDQESDLVEVQFKNTRKGYYRNTNNLPLEKGDIVAVEASPGHDIGVVTLTGRLVPLQLKKANLKSEADIKRIYRKAKPVDMEKYYEAKAREHSTMIRARQIALDLKLEMKIGDVEYQGDGNKAIFYYIADERVDFRQLIKVLAEVFRVRIEMKQIGARQEAGRIGGIGPCGRELCCATWMKSFVSVSTSAARYQDISLNPQKLAGQCAKLKCCLNYEVDCYVEAQKRLPSREIQLETKDATYFYFKADILANQITYSTDKQIPANLVTISGRRAFEVIGLNRKGIKPDSLMEEESRMDVKKPVDLLEQESLTRFDRTKGKGGSGKSNKKKKKGGEKAQTSPLVQSGEQQPQEARQPQQNPQESRQPRQGQKQGGGRQPQQGQAQQAQPQGGRQAQQEQKQGGRQSQQNPQEPRQSQQGKTQGGREPQQGEPQGTKQKSRNNRRPPRDNRPNEQASGQERGNGKELGVAKAQGAPKEQGGDKAQGASKESGAVKESGVSKAQDATKE